MISVSVHAHRGAPYQAGRLAARAALTAWCGRDDIEIVNDPDGAPRLVGAEGYISISHDAPWVAIALGDARCGVDVCAVAHEARVRRILASLGIVADAHPCLVFAAVEAALKLRREGVWSLMDRKVAVAARAVGRAREDGAQITGIGAPVDVRWELREGYALAWTEERA